MENWEHIDNFEITDDINIIHCDTRDFHCLCYSDELDTKDGKHREITKRFYDKKYQIKVDEIIPWLKNLETMSGGVKQWRHLCFDNSFYGWLKYIRMYKNPKNKNYFIVCNGENIPIIWRQCTEENLLKDSLYAH